MEAQNTGIADYWRSSDDLGEPRVSSTEAATTGTPGSTTTDTAVVNKSCEPSAKSIPRSAHLVGASEYLQGSTGVAGTQLWKHEGGGDAGRGGSVCDGKLSTLPLLPLVPPASLNMDRPEPALWVAQDGSAITHRGGQPSAWKSDNCRSVHSETGVNHPSTSLAMVMHGEPFTSLAARMARKRRQPDGDEAEDSGASVLRGSGHAAGTGRRVKQRQRSSTINTGTTPGVGGARWRQAGCTGWYASVHTRQRNHVCDYDGCGRAFSEKSKLTKHVAAVHLRERNHVCDYDGCGKAFSEKSNLTQHMKAVHLMERRHVCDYGGCGKAFSENSNLTKHMKAVHLRERNHVCDYDGCGRAFSERGSLTQHVDAVYLRERSHVCDSL